MLMARIAALSRFDRVHSAQPGYIANLTVDVGDHQRILVNVWESEQHAADALAVVGPLVGELIEPLLAAPSRFLGAGEVSTDLAAPVDG
jgi:hypothetical protein